MQRVLEGVQGHGDRVGGQVARRIVRRAVLSLGRGLIVKKSLRRAVKVAFRPVAAMPGPDVMLVLGAQCFRRIFPARAGNRAPVVTPFGTLRRLILGIAQFIILGHQPGVAGLGVGEAVAVMGSLGTNVVPRRFRAAGIQRVAQALEVRPRLVATAPIVSPLRLVPPNLTIPCPVTTFRHLARLQRGICDLLPAARRGPVLLEVGEALLGGDGGLVALGHVVRLAADSLGPVVVLLPLAVPLPLHRAAFVGVVRVADLVTQPPHVIERLPPVRRRVPLRVFVRAGLAVPAHLLQLGLGLLDAQFAGFNSAGQQFDGLVQRDGLVVGRTVLLASLILAAGHGQQFLAGDVATIAIRRAECLPPQLAHVGRAEEPIRPVLPIALFQVVHRPGVFRVLAHLRWRQGLAEPAAGTGGIASVADLATGAGCSGDAAGIRQVVAVSNLVPLFLAVTATVAN